MEQMLSRPPYRERGGKGEREGGEGERGEGERGEGGRTGRERAGGRGEGEVNTYMLT